MGPFCVLPATCFVVVSLLLMLMSPAVLVISGATVAGTDSRANKISKSQ